jgi:hypothetical protein
MSNDIISGNFFTFKWAFFTINLKIYYIPSLYDANATHTKYIFAVSGTLSPQIWHNVLQTKYT